MTITFIDNRYGIKEINGSYAEIKQFLKDFNLEEIKINHPNIPVPNWIPDQPRPIEPWYVGDPTPFISQPYKITC